MATTFKKVSNNGTSTIQADISNVATTLTIDAGHTARFPSSGDFWLNIFDSVDPTILETVLVTGVSTNTFTITRAQDGTTAQSWTTGAIVELTVRAEHISTLQTAVNTLEGDLDTLEGSAVTLAGTQTVSGAKTFSSNITMSATPTASTDVATKGYVDSHLDDGWSVPLTGSYTRNSATVINTPIDTRTFLSIGDKLEYTESLTLAVKYAYVVGLSATQITITSGSDYGGGMVASNNPTNIRYAKGNAVGFPDVFNFTPAWTNLTIGNATVLAKFNIINRRCYFEIDMTVGSTTSFTASTLITSFPVTSASPIPTYNQIGTVSMFNLSTSLFNGFLQQQNTTKAYVLVGGVAGTYLTGGGINNTVPFSWTTGWKLWISADYLIA